MGSRAWNEMGELEENGIDREAEFEEGILQSVRTQGIGGRNEKEKKKEKEKEKEKSGL